jgi:hypothetical protein
MGARTYIADSVLPEWQYSNNLVQLFSLQLNKKSVSGDLHELWQDFAYGAQGSGRHHRHFDSEVTTCQGSSVQIDLVEQRKHGGLIHFRHNSSFANR